MIIEIDSNRNSNSKSKMITKKNSKKTSIKNSKKKLKKVNKITQIKKKKFRQCIIFRFINQTNRIYAYV
jgi:hypothetical protein